MGHQLMADRKRCPTAPATALPLFDLSPATVMSPLSTTAAAGPAAGWEVRATSGQVSEMAAQWPMDATATLDKEIADTRPMSPDAEISDSPTELATGNTAALDADLDHTGNIPPPRLRRGENPAANELPPLPSGRYFAGHMIHSSLDAPDVASRCPSRIRRIRDSNDLTGNIPPPSIRRVENQDLTGNIPPPRLRRREILAANEPHPLPSERYFTGRVNHLGLDVPDVAYRCPARIRRIQGSNDLA